MLSRLKCLYCCNQRAAFHKKHLRCSSTIPTSDTNNIRSATRPHIYRRPSANVVYRPYTSFQVAHLKNPVALLSVAVMLVRIIPRRGDILGIRGSVNDATTVGYNGENRSISSTQITSMPDALHLQVNAIIGCILLVVFKLWVMNYLWVFDSLLCFPMNSCKLQLHTHNIQ